MGSQLKSFRLVLPLRSRTNFAASFIIFSLLLSFSPPPVQLITDLMPTRAQIAKKFRSEEARRWSNDVGHQRMGTAFFFLRRIDLPIRRPRVFPRVWQIFNYRSKFSIGSQISMFNMNVILPQCANSWERNSGINLGAHFNRSPFFLLSAHVNPF